jgi:hypothetical protein
MKSVLFFIFIFCFGYTSFSQTNDAADERLRRIKLVDYLDQTHFSYESPEGESVANITIWAFKENLVVLNLDNSKLSANDALKIEALKLALNSLLTIEVPSWEQIVIFETQKLKLIDSQVTRHSKYKNSEVKQSVEDVKK